MVYRTKISRWMVGTYIGLEAATTIGLIACAAFGVIDWWIVGAFAMTSVFMVGALLPIRYEVRPDAVHVQSGLREWNVPIQQIEKMYPTRDPMTAPALSLDRLRINYRDGKKRRALLIAPHDEQAFIDDVLSHDPGLRRDGLRVERALKPV